LTVSANCGCKQPGKIAADHPASSILAVSANIASPTACRKRPKDQSAFNRVTPLFTAPALSAPAPIDKIDGKDFDDGNRRHLTGALQHHSCLRVHDGRARQWGVIVNIASVAAQRGGGCGRRRPLCSVEKAGC